jgi:hypothetical protein
VDEAQDKAQKLLDINTEGKLLVEIKDILDELNMIIDIKNQQKQVSKQFQKHLNHMIAPNVTLTSYSEGGREHRDGVRRDSRGTLSAAFDLSASLDDQIAYLSNLKEISGHNEKAVSSCFHPTYTIGNNFHS